MSVIDYVATHMSALDTKSITTNLAMYSYKWARKRPKGPYALNSVPYFREAFAVVLQFQRLHM